MYTSKPNYPKEWIKNENTWLNTYDIYYVMKQYEKANKDFVFLGPIPADCPTKIHCELSNFDLMKMKKNGITKIGIIYIGTAWIISSAISLGSIFFHNNYSNYSSNQCVLFYAPIFVVSSSIVSFVLPLIFMIILYSKVNFYIIFI